MTQSFDSISMTNPGSNNIYENPQNQQSVTPTNMSASFSKDSSLLLSKQAAQATAELVSIIKAGADESNAAPGQLHQANSVMPNILGAEQKQFTGLIALQELLHRALDLMTGLSLGKLQQRLELALAKHTASTQFSTSLEAEYRQALEASQTAMAIAEADIEALQHAENDLTEKQRALNQAKAALTLLAPDDEGYAAALQAVADAEGEVNQAQGKFEQAQNKANASYNAAWDSIEKLDEIYSKSSKPNAPSLTPEPLKNIMVRLLELTLAFLKLGDANTLQKFKDQSKKVQSMQKQQQALMEKKADEHAAELQKAAALNKAMGCVGKILGGLLTLLSVVGAVFTGGASLALAAVGMALMAADMIGKAITGVSFMEKAMRPLMDNVIGPLINALSKAISKVLEGLGVDAKTAATVGAIVGALVAAALIIAAVLVGKSAAASVGKMMSNAIQKLVPEVLKKLVGQSVALVSKNFNRLMEKFSISMDRAQVLNRVNNLNRASNVLEVTNGTFQAVGTGVQGNVQRSIKTLESDLYVALQESRQINIMAAQVAEVFNQWQSLNEMLITNVSRIMDSYQQTRIDLFSFSRTSA
ncbi:type III secretion system translocon subunit SctE [Acerihabitans sp.]|uniref:type III secretion system translocon subunit SctE n=1 Tax=Acerihabitans sp. TaxID=2811394 RepID=UPI002EDA783C